MSLEFIKDKVVDICLHLFQDVRLDVYSIEHMDFVDDLGMDSITFISLVIEVETEFAITLPEDKLLIDNFKNLSEIIEIVRTQLTSNNKSDNNDK